MKYTHILWDFNGTILDDVEAGIISVNKMLTDRGLKAISGKDEYREVFGFPIIDYYRRIGFDLEAEPFHMIAPIWVEQYMKNVKNAAVYDDFLETAERFRTEGLKQVIMSATEINMLVGQLSDLSVIDYFDDICGLDNIHAESKADIAMEWRRRNEKAVPLMIGDTLHDAEVAEKIGADCILVPRGHQSKSVLIESGATVVDRLRDIIL